MKYRNYKREEEEEKEAKVEQVEGVCGVCRSSHLNEQTNTVTHTVKIESNPNIIQNEGPLSHPAVP